MLAERKLWMVVICSLAFVACPSLYGQANGSFSGTVTDKTGSVISGARLTITSQATGLTRQVTTDGSGHYLAPLLPVANYTLQVEASGFQPIAQKDVRLQPGAERLLTSRGADQRRSRCRRDHQPNSRPSHHFSASSGTPSKRPRLCATGNPYTGNDPGDESE